jgi:hypothetical protein
MRVSTVEQTTENQERELRRVADRMRCEIVAVHRDNGISGAKGRNGRLVFDVLCKAAARREFDIIMAWSVDRLGRSLQDLVGFLSEIHALRVDLYLHQQGIDTTTPGGKTMFQMCGAFAEFERAMIDKVAEDLDILWARYNRQDDLSGGRDASARRSRGTRSSGSGKASRPGSSACRAWRRRSRRTPSGTYGARYREQREPTAALSGRLFGSDLNLDYCPS